MMNDRRSFLAGACATLLTASIRRTSAQEQAPDRIFDGMVMRRPMDSGEDQLLYRMGQLGPYLPSPEMIAVNVGTRQVLVNFPANQPSGRLIVLSHGVLNDPRVYRRMIAHLASHGFVVAAPVHEDGLLRKGLTARSLNSMAEGSWNVESILKDSKSWTERVKACSAPLDDVAAISATIGMKVDIERPILIGHEFGAFCAQIAVGVTSEATSEVLSDPRWFASILLSPQGPGVMGLSETSWTNMKRPLLAVISARERDFFEQDPIKKASCFVLSPPGNKHLAWFEKGNENLYSGPRAGTDEQEARRYEDLLATITSYCFAYANYDADVFKHVSTDWIDRETLGRVKTRYR
jgi:hypothetical protein